MTDALIHERLCATDGERAESLFIQNDRPRIDAIIESTMYPTTGRDPFQKVRDALDEVYVRALALGFGDKQSEGVRMACLFLYCDLRLRRRQVGLPPSPQA